MTSIRHRVLAAALAGTTLLGAATIVDAPVAASQEAPADADDRQADRRAKLEARLAEAVAEGRITQERADAMLERLDAQAERFAERRGQAEGDRDERREAREARRAERQEAREARAEALAGVLGTTVDDMAQSLRDGASIADLAAANGVALDDVIAHFVDAANERIDAAVEAGRLDAARADQMRSTLEDSITERITNGRPDRSDRGDGERGNRFRPDRGQRGPAGD